MSELLNLSFGWPGGCPKKSLHVWPTPSIIMTSTVRKIIWISKDHVQTSLVMSPFFSSIFSYSARHNYTRGVTKYDNFFLAPPGTTKTEIEQFWHMEMVGVIITRIWFSGRKSRSVNNFFQRPDLGLRWNFTPRVNPPDRTNPPPGADFSILPSGFNYDTQSNNHPKQ